MRILTQEELTFVSGACAPTPPACPPTPPPPPACPPRQKGNNGFGNGPNDGVPGRSGKTDATR